jgi:hypothetical protein
VQASDDTAPTLVGRKSVLMGMAASMGAIFANAAPPAAAAVQLPKWELFTNYARGQLIISPNIHVVSANVAHRSSWSYETDKMKWRLSCTFVPQVLTQVTEGIAVPIFTVSPRTAGAPPFQFHQNSYPNVGAGVGTITTPLMSGSTRHATPEAPAWSTITPRS